MAENIGASFTIDINNLKAGLNTANKLIRESQSEFKAAAAGMDDWRKSEEGLTAKIQSLSKIVEVQREKVSKLKDAYQKELANGLDEASDRAVQLRTQINKEEAALKENEAEVRRNEKALDDLGNETDDAADKSKKAANGGFTVLKGVLANLAADAIRKCIEGMKSLAKGVVEAGIDFDNSMSQVAAVSGATTEEIDALTQKAKEMGAKTKFSASESADAFNYMAMAGWKTEEMIGGIEGIMNLAAASGADLATASDIVTDALTAMGYAAKDSGRLADVMAAASSNANTNVEMMGQTFQYAAPIVGALGYSMEDTAVAIGLMANAGIKGEKAGTALRSVLTRLSAPPKECSDALIQLGVSILDNNGKMKSLDTVMQDLRKAFDGLSETEQTAMAKSIAGQEAMSGLLAIVNAAPADFDKLTKAVENSNGAAEKMANTMLDNLGGDITLLKSAWEGFNIQLYESANGTMRQVVQEITNGIIPALSDMVNGVDGAGEQFGKSVSNIFKTIINALKKAMPQLAKALSTIIQELLGAIVDATPEFVKAIVEVAPQLIKAIIGMLPALQSTLVEVILAIIDAITEMIPDVVDAIMKVVPQLINGLVAAIPKLLQAAIKLFTAIVQAIPVIIEELLKELPSIIDTIISTLLGSLPELIDAAIELLMAIVDAIPQIITALVEALPTIIETILSSLFNPETFEQIIQGAIQLLMGIIKAIPQIITALVNSLPQIINTIVSTLLDPQNLAMVIKGAVQLFMGIVKAIPQIIVELVKNLPQIIASIVQGLLQGIPEMFKVGGDLIKGLWNGIKDAGAWLAEKIGGFFGGIVDNIKKFFGIASPSKLMENLIGKNMALGIGEGFSEEMKNVNRDIVRSLSDLENIDVGGLNSSLEKSLATSVNVSGQSAARQVTVNQYNTYSQPHTRYEIYKSKQLTAAAVRLAMGTV